MGIQLTADQVVTMAPDSSSSAAGKKLAAARHWKSLGQSQAALWGECQGSALYQVKIDLATLTIQCSCPSRKQPCKHGLGLLLLTVTTPSAVPETEQPEWITSWLAKRETTRKQKEASTTQKSNKAPSASQVKNAEKRLAQVTAGIEQLDLWLNDLLRNGLGSLETQPAKFWENQAAKMVDTQAPGIATRIRAMAGIPNASPDWPAKLLTQMGKLALLTQAFHRLDQFDVPFQEDIRQLVGWTLKEDEVLARGMHVDDDWLIVGQTTRERERGRSQNTWLLGTSSRRSALLLQFAFVGAAFPEVYPIGAHQQADVAYWPGKCPQRALIATRRGEAAPIQDPLPGFATIDAFFDDIAAILAQYPWRELFLCTLNNAIPTYDATHNQGYISDADGQTLPLEKNTHWQLLALSGGMPIDFVGEWDGETLHPLGALVDHQYYVL